MFDCVEGGFFPQLLCALFFQAGGEVGDDGDWLVDLLRDSLQQQSFAVGRDAVKGNCQNLPLVNERLK